MPTIWFLSWRWTAVNFDLWPLPSTSVHLALFPQPEVKSPCTLGCGVCDSDVPSSTFQPSTYINVCLPSTQTSSPNISPAFSVTAQSDSKTFNLRINVFFFCLPAILMFLWHLPGVLGAGVQGFNLPCEDQPITCRMAIISGTSTCHMAVSVSFRFHSFRMIKAAALCFLPVLNFFHHFLCPAWPIFSVQTSNCKASLRSLVATLSHQEHK